MGIAQCGHIARGPGGFGCADDAGAGAGAGCVPFAVRPACRADVAAVGFAWCWDATAVGAPAAGDTEKPQAGLARSVGSAAPAIPFVRNDGGRRAA